MKDYVLKNKAVGWESGQVVGRLFFSSYPKAMVSAYKNNYIELTTPSDKPYYIVFNTESERDEELKLIQYHLDPNLKTSVAQGAITMFNEVTADAKAFIKTNKSTIYMIAVLIIADHLLFNGAYRMKLKEMMEKLVGKVSSDLDKGLALAPAPQSKV